MKRQWITAGVIGICLLLLGAVWSFLGTSEDSSKEKKSKDIIVLGKKDVIQDLLVENDKGGYHLSWNEDEAEAEGMGDLPLDKSEIDGIQNKIQNLTAEREIKQGKERLADFGLENPASKATINLKDGKSITLLVGDEVPDEESIQRYVLWDDRVLTVKSSHIEGLLYGRENLVSRSLTPDLPNNEENYLITKMTISQQDEEDLILEYTDSEELAGYTVNSYQMVSPRNYPADAGITENVFPALFGIEADSVVKLHPSEEEKENVGLGIPWKTIVVEYTDNSGEKQSFLLQASYPDNGIVYVMSNEIDAIYVCAQESLPWLEETEDTLVSHTVLASDIKSIKELKIIAEGEQYTFQFQNVGEKEENISYEGREMDGESFRNFYYTLAGFFADEVLFEDFPDTGALEKVAEIRYMYQDGTEDILTCFNEQSRKIYVELNQGERGYRMSATQIETMLDTLKHLVEGEKIEARY